MNVNEQSNIADIAARHNELSGKGADPKSLAKRGKAKLLEQIKTMEDAKAAAAAIELGAAPEAVEEAKEQPNGLAMLLKQMQDAKEKKASTKPKAEPKPK